MICTGFVLLRGDGRGQITDKKHRRKQCSNPTQKWTNGGFKTYGNNQIPLQRASKGSNGKKEKNYPCTCHRLVPWIYSTFNTTFQQKFLQAEMANFHKLTPLMSFEVITLKTAGNNVSKQINAKAIKWGKYVKRYRHVTWCNYTKRDISTEQKLSKSLSYL